MLVASPGDIVPLNYVVGNVVATSGGCGDTTLSMSSATNREEGNGEGDGTINNIAATFDTLELINIYF